MLCANNSTETEEKFKPAYLLSDGRLERAGRVKKVSPVGGSLSSLSNGPSVVDKQKRSLLTASVIAVGDEIL